jgi:hypothetical protein
MSNQHSKLEQAGPFDAVIVGAGFAGMYMLHLQGDRETAAEALPALLRLRPDLSLAWLRENMTSAGEMGERLLEGLRKAGVPQG